MGYRVLLGDCVEVMAGMEAASFDSIVCDPPYSLGFMGRQWDKNLNHGPWATEAIRVAKPGAHLLAFGGTRTYHRLTCALEDAGWEIRDCLVWCYASGFPKSLNLNGDWQGWGTALKPAWEPIVLARKPLAGTVAANIQRYGTGALNIDATRILTEPYNPAHHRSSTSPHPMDWGEDNGGRESDASKGRWPPNLLLTDAELFDVRNDGVVGSGAVATSGNGVRRVALRADWEGGPLQPDPAEWDGDTGGYARFFLVPKASRSDREPVWGEELGSGVWSDGRDAPADYPSQRGKTVRRNTHPTTKPVDLMRHLVRLVTPPAGRILDPFLGSGTTAIAAIMEGFTCVGIEREPEYVAIAEARLNGVQQGMGLSA